MTAQLTNIPAFLNIVGYGGDTVTFKLTLKDKTTNTAIPITGTISAQIRRCKGDDEFWTITTVAGTSTGEINCTIAPAVSGELAIYATRQSLYIGDELLTGQIFSGYWDLQVKNTDTKTYVSGEVYIIGEVTR